MFSFPLNSERGAALLLHAWRASRFLADWDEEKHPRDDHGKFSSTGGDQEPVLQAKKVTATQSTILSVYEKTKAGQSLSSIADEHNLSVEQVKWINLKIKNQVPQMKKVLGEKNPHANQPPSTPKKEESPHPPGYSWEQKTVVNSPGGLPENLGKYAYFKEGVQVSAPFANKEDYKQAIPTMHQGTGPQKPEPIGNLHPVGEHTEGWPISNDTARKLGTSYPTKLENSQYSWRQNLTDEERSAIQSYTGSGYQTINDILRDKSSGSEYYGKQIPHIEKALAKAPSPPPPELVWRGLSGSNSSQFAKSLSSGDVIKLKGFQSTSINPGFAHSWGSGTVFEIKPAKGGYVKPLSSHQNEYEYLLPHGADYKVHGVATVKLGGTVTKVVQLEMLK